MYITLVIVQLKRLPVRGNIEGSAGGIIASSFENGATFNIINAYNIGRIETNNRFSSGIFGCKNHNFTNSYIKNVYNLGSLTGGTTNGIIGFEPSKNVSLSPSQIENVFYLNNTDKGTNANDDTFTKYTETQIKDESFVNKLNEYVEKNPVYTVEKLSIPLLKWKLSADKYPVFE